MDSPDTIPPQRVKPLHDADSPRKQADYVLYWMQQSQRAEWNHALELAIAWANQLQRPLRVAFGLMDNYPEANRRHYRFLLEGLRDVQQSLLQRNIPLHILRGHPAEVAIDQAGQAAVVICDRGYLRHQKQWRRELAEQAQCPVFQVESDVVVPVEEASDKVEYAARTIRPKVTQRWQEFLVQPPRTKLKVKSPPPTKNATFDLSDLDRAMDRLELEDVPSVEQFHRGGESAGRERLRKFLAQRFDEYDRHRNQPQTDDVSYMSMYLHFGHLSPLEIAMAVKESAGSQEDVDSYLEELLVRRELAQNFVEFHDQYDKYECLPHWARTTLDQHRGDPRAYVYSREELENAETHDDYWNAAMREMRHSGYMHNYMRMYWGKKILEWSRTPEEAYATALALNNKHFLDGRDANSFANVAWIFGLHDRAFQEREVYGKVRYMAASGLKRKCDIEGYVAKVDRLVAQVND